MHPNIVAMIDRCAPLWAAEAEIVRTYWDSPVRTAATDRLWLLRQMYKELWDGFYPSFEWIAGHFRQLEAGCSRDDLLDEAEVMQEELAHYVAFAAVLDELPMPSGSGAPDAIRLRELGNWPENAALMELRARHVREQGVLGTRAHRFTEGGYCTLYAEGMKLRSRGGFDRCIADACAKVYDDEFDHMLRGIATLARELHPLSDKQWEMLSDLAAEQLRYRLRMRNAQFSFPVDEGRMSALAAGVCDPLSFDYERAFGSGVR